MRAHQRAICKKETFGNRFSALGNPCPMIYGLRFSPRGLYSRQIALCLPLGQGNASPGDRAMLHLAVIIDEFVAPILIALLTWDITTARRLGQKLALGLLEASLIPSFVVPWLLGFIH